MAGTTADRGRQVRQRLLRTTAELIAERGWAAVSTRIVADRAGVAPGVVHYHFGSMQALRAEAALSAMRELTDRMVPALRDAPTAADALALIVGSLDGYDGTDPMSLLFAETYLAAARDPDLRRELTAIVDRFRGEIAEILTAYGVQAPAATAAVVAASLDGIMLHRPLGLGGGAADLTAVLGRLLRVAPTAAHPRAEQGGTGA